MVINRMCCGRGEGEVVVVRSAARDIFTIRKKLRLAELGLVPVDIYVGVTSFIHQIQSYAALIF
jgi:hypothetical protein